MTEPATQAFPWKILTTSPEEWRQRTIVLYGPSGVGKTTLAAQFPEPLILGCDPGVLGGSLSAASFNVKHLKISSYSQIIDLMPILQKNAGTEFRTIIIDSMTYLGKLCLDAILKQTGREKATRDEFGLNYTRVSRLISNFSELPCHVVFTAIDSITKDEITGKMFGGPDLVGKLSQELPQAVDICARLYVITSYNQQGKLETKYRYRCVPDDMYFAKDRTNLLEREGLANFDSFIKPLFSDKEFKKGE